MKKLLPLLVAALIAVLVGTGCNVTPYAAVVNGVTISQADLNADLAALHSNTQLMTAVRSQTQVEGQGAGTYDSRFVSSVLGGKISAVLVSQELDRRGITVTQADLALAQEDVVASFSASLSGQSGQVNSSLGGQVFSAFPARYRDELVRDSAALTALEAYYGGVDLSPQALQRYYNQHPADFTLVCVSDIEVSTQAEAQSLRAQLAGGANFSDLARAHSINTGAQQTGGDLGCNPPGTFVPAFEQVIAGLAPGQVSQPVQISSSWHLVTVTGRQLEPFDAVAAEIRQRLLQAHSGGISGRLQRLQAQAKVTVNPTYCSAFKTTGAQAGCVPPVGPPPGLLTMPGATAQTTGTQGGSSSGGGGQ